MTEKFCSLLKKMIDEEDKAGDKYADLKQYADPETKKLITRIQKDEKKHYRLLKKKLEILCK